MTTDRWVISAKDGPDYIGRAREIWRYRSIVGFFGSRALEMLYARTQLGWLWLVIRPLAPLLAGAFVYGGIMNVQTPGNVPYFQFLLASMIAWSMFDGPLGWGTRGLELNRHLITKLYFPRSVLPLATMTPGLVDPVVGAGVLAIAVTWTGVRTGAWHVDLSLRMLVLVVPVAIALTLAYGISLWTSVWQARARDVRFALGFVTSFWMFLTPVIYPLELVPDRVRWIVEINPMTPIVETFRWALFGHGVFAPGLLARSAVVAVVAVASGFWYFHRVEANTADKM